MPLKVRWMKNVGCQSLHSVNVVFKFVSRPATDPCIQMQMPASDNHFDERALNYATSMNE